MTMKKLSFLFISISLFVAGNLSAKTYTITNSGYTFVPDSISINIGDQVTFSLGSMHNAVEVSQATWDAGGNTSNGGFSVPYGGGTVTFSTTGTYYYVCQPHAHLGMKGIIVVNNTPTAILNAGTETNSDLFIFPNPARDHVNLSFSVFNNSNINIDLLDITGNRVRVFVSGNYSTGKYSLNFPVNDVISGKYFVRFACGDVILVKPVLIYNKL